MASVLFDIDTEAVKVRWPVPQAFPRQIDLQQAYVRTFSAVWRTAQPTGIVFERFHDHCPLEVELGVVREHLVLAPTTGAKVLALDPAGVSELTVRSDDFQ